MTLSAQEQAIQKMTTTTKTTLARGYRPDADTWFKYIEMCQLAFGKITKREERASLDISDYVTYDEWHTMYDNDQPANAVVELALTRYGNS